MNICTYTYEEYLHLVKSFHGSLAPGLIIGGFIVDLALKHLPEGELFDALCETPVCLPDAVQILTPCTIGNGWLTVFDIGRFAVTMYEKKGGQGVRVFLDAKKLGNWPEIRDWYLKRKKKQEQNFERLLAQIKEAGHDLLSVQRVRVEPEKIRRKKLGPVGICPVCGEPYPARDGECCRNCRGESPYTEIADIGTPS
ncbi:MAG: formylmethanofuran dehydrogenase subunit E family protein [Syntrophales bacterium]|jgi:formylmethanofuran dehydrogenase subunit E|nr:formylmethanofuran dehydrogenase subunit E family protein [Syntrophales bacterium]